MFEIKVWGENLSAAEAVGMYHRAKAAGTLALAWYDVPPDDLGGQGTFLAWLDWLKHLGGQAAGVWDEGEAKCFFWLTAFEGLTARIHFCLWGAPKAERLALGRHVIAWCFERFGLVSLTGWPPVINQGALKYALELGGRLVGTVPGACKFATMTRAVPAAVVVFQR